MEQKVFTFNEKETEYSAKDGRELPVIKTNKYLKAKKEVTKMLLSEEYKDVLDESDFWILMNSTKTGKMAYTGLIISHNGCLKINDTLPEELKFEPKCLNYCTPENDCSYKNSLVFVYDSSKLAENDKQKIYEVGEVTEKNCKNDYPYAMALKRCMDRVILKNSKLAYSGVYSDSEAEEFSEMGNIENNTRPAIQATPSQLKFIQNLFENDVEELKEILEKLGKKNTGELSVEEASKIISNKKEQQTLTSVVDESQV